jgi:AcrR family transcriptional regulator
LTIDRERLQRGRVFEMNATAGRRAKSGKAMSRARRTSPGGRDRAAQIMDVALDLFATKDYTSVTVNQIADVIGIRHSLIYYYFDSKEDLFNKTLEGHIAKTMEDYRALAGETSNPVEAIENWFDINMQLSTPCENSSRSCSTTPVPEPIHSRYPMRSTNFTGPSGKSLRREFQVVSRAAYFAPSIPTESRRSYPPTSTASSFRPSCATMLTSPPTWQN